MSKRRLLVLTLALAVLVLLAPLWSGYLGPSQAAYVSVWRPWRSGLSVHADSLPSGDDRYVMVVAEYRDPWPGQARTPGRQTDFMQVRRYSPVLPWLVTSHGTGP